MAAGAAPLRPRRLVAVVNPASGGGIGRRRLQGIRRLASEAGCALEAVWTRGPGDVARAVAEAAAAGPDAVVLVGGDGSVGELCRAYVGLEASRRPPVLIVPAGRGNSLYKALLSDAPWDLYLRRALAAAEVRPTDAGLVAETGDVWVLGFSVGYLHDAVAAAARFPALRGRGLYAAAGAYAAARVRPFRAEVLVDGRAVFCGRAYMVAVGGGAFRGGRLHLFPTSDLSDGLLDVVCVEACGRRRFVEVLRAAGPGAHLQLREVHAFQGCEVRIASDGTLRAEADGTIYRAGTAVTLRCLPGLLPVALPAWTMPDAPAPAR